MFLVYISADFRTVNGFIIMKIRLYSDICLHYVNYFDGFCRGHTRVQINLITSFVDSRCVGYCIHTFIKDSTTLSITNYVFCFFDYLTKTFQLKTLYDAGLIGK